MSNGFRHRTGSRGIVCNVWTDAAREAAIEKRREEAHGSDDAYAAEAKYLSDSPAARFQDKQPESDVVHPDGEYHDRDKSYYPQDKFETGTRLRAQAYGKDAFPDLSEKRAMYMRMTYITARDHMDHEGVANTPENFRAAVTKAADQHAKNFPFLRSGRKDVENDVHAHYGKLLEAEKN